MYKKLLTLIFVFSLSLFLGGCTIGGYTFNMPNIPYLSNLIPGSNSASKEANLTYWSLFEPYDVYESSIVNYQNQNKGVTVNYEQRVYETLDTYKDSLIASLKTGEGPDIMRIHISWVSDFKDYIAPAPSNTITPETFKSRFYKPASDNLIINNQVYGVPLYYDSLALIYNKDLFAAKNKVAPATWSDFKDVAESLTVASNGKIDIAGAAFGSAGNVAHFSDIFGLFVNQSEMTLPDDMDSSQMEYLVEFYTNFVKGLKVWDASFAYSPLAFAEGKVAMMVAPSWQLLNILAQNPNLNVGVAPVPQIVANDKLTAGAYPNFFVEVVNKNSKGKDAAWAFLNYLSQKEQQQAYFNLAQQKRPFGAPYSDVELQSSLSSDPYLAPYFVNADNGKVQKITYLSGNDNYVRVFRTVIEGALNGGNIKELLKTAKTEYQRLETQ